MRKKPIYLCVLGVCGVRGKVDSGLLQAGGSSPSPWAVYFGPGQQAHGGTSVVGRSDRREELVGRS